MKSTAAVRTASVLIAAAGLTAVGGGAAYAVWSAAGTGSGAAQAGSFLAPTVSNGTTAADLYPGLVANGTSTGGALAVVASNPNAFPITVTLSQNGAPTGCTTTGVSFRGGSFQLPAQTSNVTRTVSFSVAMTNDSSNDCQSKTISIPLTTASVSG